MLTDRQQKFYNQISALAAPSSSATNEERKYLSSAKQKIDVGNKFSDCINSLNRALKALDFGKLQAGGLTPDVKKLYEELKASYGEPHGLYDNVPEEKWQRDAPPGWIYVGGGGWSGWRRKDELNKPKSLKSEILYLLLIIVTVVVIGFIVFFLEEK